jgi:hypothetical protein
MTINAKSYRVISSTAAFIVLAFTSSCGTSDDGGAGTAGSGGASGSNAGGSGGASASGGTSGTGGVDSGPPADGGQRDSTGDVAPGQPVNLGAAADYVILAKSGVSTVPASVITGNIGVSPAAATYITGFSLTADSTNAFSTSTQVTGKVYAADYTAPTPSNLTTAVGDMELAFTDAAGRAPSATEVGAGNIGGMTLTPGIYQWGTGLNIPTDLTLTGNATDVWIFQIAQNLTIANAAKVRLTGGAVPKNVFWQVAGRVDLGTSSHCEGVVMTQTAITLGTGASVLGRLLAQTTVNIDSSTLVAPLP